MRKNMYKWHRKISIITAFPVLIWALSGLLHPIMTNIRPAIFTQQSPQKSIDTNSLKVPIYDAFRLNNIAAFFNCRIVNLNNTYYYQVKKTKENLPVYISATDGKVLPEGDKLYAIYLAEHFVSPVLLKVQATELTIAFTDDYNKINKLLPVWKVAFKRVDGITIYVDTQESRFSFATNRTRNILTRAFAILHTWSWTGNLTLFKIILIAALMLLTFINGIAGIYLFFKTKSKNIPGNKTVQRRRNHRFTAIFASLFTLFFSFSGCVHILSQLKKDKRGEVISEQSITREECNFNLTETLRTLKQPVQDLSFVKMNGNLYIRAVLFNQDSTGKDLMKEMKTADRNAVFINSQDYTVLPKGEESYAKYLASAYLGGKTKSSKAVEITAFDENYDFADKVLPVWKVTTGSGILYVETGTAKLRKLPSAVDKFDDYSFAFLHKHEFMMWAGKSVKDFSTVFWTAVQVIMIVFGLILYFNKKKIKVK